MGDRSTFLIERKQNVNLYTNFSNRKSQITAFVSEKFKMQNLVPQHKVPNYRYLGKYSPHPFPRFSVDVYFLVPVSLSHNSVEIKSTEMFAEELIKLDNMIN